MMISRMILSLKRAAGHQRADRSLWSSVDDTNLRSIRFARPQNSADPVGDEMSLEAYPGS